MSRSFRFDIVIHDVTQAEHLTIDNAIDPIWDTEGASEFFAPASQYEVSSEGVLYGGQGDDEVAKLIAEAVFKALGREVSVDISTTYLDDLPYDSYHFGPGGDEDEESEYLKEDPV